MVKTEHPDHPSEQQEPDIIKDVDDDWWYYYYHAPKDP
jgi:hypothetical protein